MNQYFAIDAAVAMEAYDRTARDPNMINPEPLSSNYSWKDYDERLYASSWFKLFDGSDGRNKLTWQARFGTIQNMFNFFSTGEEVLMDSNGRVPWLLGNDGP